MKKEWFQVSDLNDAWQDWNDSDRSQRFGQFIMNVYGFEMPKDEKDIWEIKDGKEVYDLVMAYLEKVHAV